MFHVYSTMMIVVVNLDFNIYKHRCRLDTFLCHEMEDELKCRVPTVIIPSDLQSMALIK